MCKKAKYHYDSFEFSQISEFEMKDLPREQHMNKHISADLFYHFLLFIFLLIL